MNFIQKNYKTVLFFAQLHVSTCPEMLEWSCLYDKEMNMCFRAQRQTECSNNVDAQTLVFSKIVFL